MNLDEIIEHEFVWLYEPACEIPDIYKPAIKIAAKIIAEKHMAEKKESFYGRMAAKLEKENKKLRVALEANAKSG